MPDSEHNDIETPRPQPTAPDLLRDLTALTADARAAVRAAATPAELAAVRRELLGRSGTLPALRRRIGPLPAADRRTAGAALHAVQQQLTAEIETRERDLLDAEPAVAVPLDVTVPGRPVGGGGLHPTTQLRYDLDDAFAALNFEVYAGPEISSERYEFDALNFPPEHPARETMDTYWLAGDAGRAGDGDGPGTDRRCLRPHLTGASVRYLREHPPPVRIVYPGRVYRNESTDARHERAFFQYEVLLVDTDVPLSTARFLVDTILETTFGAPVRTRMRAGFFPFVEPGFEIDMECQVCAGRGCRTCRQVGWLEVMPGGSPHPNVLRAAGLDPDRWTGCYLNVGLDRLVMMRYGIDDVRLMHGADLRFLDQFC
ncbi:phenylalanine--tRNA ligase subunit alpha [Plantactinospora siamensis]|uniref:Phenylalanine--tRNA ligase subunit alpha n=1 Tax=Plantactinospora siamensis TaxID=555372 RepID=A0ABV6P0D1_9ACTN